MKALYIASRYTFSGKSALCAGLGRRFIDDGFNIGYMKPVSTTAKYVRGQVVDEDADFMRHVFSLREASDDIAPICLTIRHVERILAGNGDDYVTQLKEAFERVSKNKDVVILEGTSGISEGAIVGLPAAEVIKLLDAKVVLAARYENDLVVDAALAWKKQLGERLVGVVLNAVPHGRISFVEESIVPFLKQENITTLAVLPQERVLLSISVGELAEALGGEILNSPERSNELVENLMVGAMSVDSALSYFRRKPNKAVFTGGDRPDIQLAALETSTKCLILTGNLQPNPIILARAEEMDVPMILVKHDTLSAVEITEQFFGRIRFHQPKKIRKFVSLLTERFDFDTLYAALGLQK
jgi:BioD-like phosphotransacetylase family protein